mmetsp:Transcript_26319/g.58492  ORF Transcript_26319/g.58492 Transcript_26319/m.58492 type:complete len:411 (+) Transcript_26319:163-1395(+)
MGPAAATRRRKGSPGHAGTSMDIIDRGGSDEPVAITTETGPETPLLSDHDAHDAAADPCPTTSPPSPSSSRPLLHRVVSSFAIPLTDQTGSASNILLGLFNLAIVGSVLGIVVPKDPTLPTPWYRTVSSIIGYTYFCAWSISFYPQIILNYSRKSTTGLSNDFGVLNVAGFACYATYTLCMYWSPSIQRQYRERYGDDAEITVQSNDVAFALHALLLCVVQVTQIWWYGGFDAQPLSLPVKLGVASLFVVCVVYASLVVEHVHGLEWLDYLYMLSFVKVVISLVKYMPQVVLNYNRKSTAGWNIWNIILDFTGGTLSVAQQIADSADLHDFSGITGNPAKFALGFVSMFFDVIFFLQHYVLYPDGEESGTGNGGDVGSIGEAAAEVTAEAPLLDAAGGTAGGVEPDLEQV